MVAQADNQTFTVESILSHKFVPNQKNRGNMQLYVKWLGYPTPSWEPYANVATVKIFHDYLISHKLQYLLRTGYKKRKIGDN